MTPEEFARFLQRLAPDTEEAGRLYIRMHERLVGLFKLKGISDPGDAADETIERASQLLEAGRTAPDVEKFCRGVARNIAHERWRREQRESSTFRRFLESLADGSNKEIERIQNLLKPCFEALEAKDRLLLRSYCKLIRGRARAEHRRLLAENLKTTVRALRISVTRLRKRLHDCMMQRLENT
jgi:DNA-directed RNA polymerase specialized sigma24 family protein